MRILLLGLPALAACWSAPPQPTFGAPPEPLVLTAAPGSPPARAGLADVAWIAGDWVGEALGGDSEETWGPPKAGAMLCMYRLVRAGAPVFYELCTIAEVDGSLEFRVKHFAPDMTGWEEKAEVERFGLVRVGADTVWFDGVTYHRDGPDGLRAWVRIRHGDGSVSDEEFRYRRRGS